MSVHGCRRVALEAVSLLLALTLAPPQHLMPSRHALLADSWSNAVAAEGLTRTATPSS